jgi:oxygen-independent coproporphyrinogen-3 oxidase
MKYWKWQDYFGFGAGAHSFVHGRRLINDLKVDDYVRAERMPLREDIRGLNARMAEFFMTGLRLLDGISKNRFQEIFAIPIPDDIAGRIEVLSGRGMIAVEQSEGDVKYRLSEEGMFLMDSVLIDLLDPLL